MNTLLESKEINGFKYEVHIDERPVDESFDFGDETANAEYLQRFQDEELFSFDVVKLKICDCCKQWEVVDSLGAIHAESTEEALKYYFEQCEA